MKKSYLLKDEIYRVYNRETNMAFSELIKWKKNPLSRKASLSRKPINLAIRLKYKRKKDWKLRDYRGAIKAIRYLRRAKHIKSRNYIPGTKLTYNDAALRNWGYDPKKRYI